MGQREEIFRADLRKLFPPPRYEVPLRGFRLRRANGDELTDVDAVIIDHETGSLALVQLKWHDIFGRSLRERNSRRLNFLKANEWVERVAGWVANRSAREVANAIGAGVAGEDTTPQIFVVARHSARFTANEVLDPRAAWLGWAELVFAQAHFVGSNLIAALFNEYAGGGAKAEVQYESSETFYFREMTVEVKVV